MSEIDKVLISIVCRDNNVILEHFLDSLEKRPSGYDYDVLIVDSESTNIKHLNALDRLSKKYEVLKVSNNRVEANYNLAWKKNKNYKYYFFAHDDMFIHKDNWLKLYIDRMHSGYCEPEAIGSKYEKYPIGKVSISSQYWRTYDNVKGYPVQCLFLKHVLEIIRPNNVPDMFKYCGDAGVLINQECINSTNGFRHTYDFKELQMENVELYSKLCDVLNKYLPYKDEGTYPKDLYPAGECWTKFCLTAEFLNYVDPLINGFRSVGISDDGYLEQIHGFETPMQHYPIIHYGSPEFRKFIGKQLGSNMDDVKKHFNNKAFLLKMDKLYLDWEKNNGKL